MTISFLGFAKANHSTNNNSVNLTLPTGITSGAGNILIASMCIGSGAAITTPTGWNLIYNTVDNNSRTFNTYWAEYVTGLATSFTIGGSTTSSNVCAAFGGCNRVNPIETSSVKVTSNQSTTIAGTAVTTSKIQEMIIWIGEASGSSSFVITRPSALTSTANSQTTSSPFPTLELGYGIFSPAGTIGSTYYSGTMSVSHFSACHILGLQYPPPYDLLSSL